MVTLKQILSMPRFSDLQLLVTDSPLLETELTSVEISETPDMASHVAKNSIILTTAMAYEDDQSELKDLIDSLVNLGTAGLGIKVGRFLGKLDEEIIEYAQDRKFPIFLIPDDYSLGSLLHQFLNIIWDTQHDEINFALDIQRKLSDLLFQEGSLDYFTKTFSQMIQTPVIVLNPFFEVISNSNHFKRDHNEADSYARQIFDELKSSPKNKGHFTLMTSQGDNVNVSLIPIQVYKRFPHYMLIFSPEQVVYPISDFAFEQAGIVLSYMLFKDDRIAASKYTLEADNFLDAINNLALTANQEGQVFQHKNIEHFLPENIALSDYNQIIHIYVSDNYSSIGLSPIQVEKLTISFYWLRTHIQSYIPNGLIYQLKNNHEIILLLQDHTPDLEKVIKKINEDFNYITGINLIFSIGNAYSNIQWIHQSYTEACVVFQERSTGANMDKSLIKSFENKGVVHLFSQIKDSDLGYFCKTTLKDLAYPTSSSLLDLRETLQAYLDNQCEIAKTARELYIHRNTVRYRIQQCEEILGFEINEPDNSLNLRLALKLSEPKQNSN